MGQPGQTYIEQQEVGIYTVLFYLKFLAVEYNELKF